VGGVPGVAPFRGLLLPSKPWSARRCPACPLDVVPASCASPILGGRTRGRADRHLGFRSGDHFSSSGP
jgi:hypothetical protein